MVSSMAGVSESMKSEEKISEKDYNYALKLSLNSDLQLSIYQSFFLQRQSSSIFE